MTTMTQRRRLGGAARHGRGARARRCRGLQWSVNGRDRDVSARARTASPRPSGGRRWGARGAGRRAPRLRPRRRSTRTARAASPTPSGGARASVGSPRGATRHETQACASTSGRPRARRAARARRARGARRGRRAPAPRAHVVIVESRAPPPAVVVVVVVASFVAVKKTHDEEAVRSALDRTRHRRADPPLTATPTCVPCRSSIAPRDKNAPRSCSNSGDHDGSPGETVPR